MASSSRRPASDRENADCVAEVAVQCARADALGLEHEREVAAIRSGRAMMEINQSASSRAAPYREFRQPEH